MNTQDRTMQQKYSCVAITQRGLMPGTVVGVDEEGLIQVQAPNSTRVYSFPDEAILSPEEGLRRMESRRVQKVAHEYQFEELNERPMVIHCHDPRHPRRSNYVLALGRQGWTCTCEAFSRSGRRRCKHISAWMELKKLEHRPDCSQVVRPSLKKAKSNPAQPELDLQCAA